VRIHHPAFRLLRDERGIALPMALLALLILSTLVIAFSLLATSEPLIATNQKMVAQARAVAESGLEKAIWALNNPTDLTNGLSAMPGPSPYDGLTDIAISDSSGTQIGVARVIVTQGTNTNERNVVSVGWVPTNPGKAHQKIQATVSQFLFKGSPPPASLTVAGEINVGGNANIDSRGDTSCGAKDGTWSQGSTAYGGSGAVYGADGNNTQNQTAAGLTSTSPITDIRQSVPATAFDPYTLKNADLNSLKALAKANGTYFSGSSVTSLLFNSGHQLPNGIIFIDTVSGQNIDANAPVGTNCLLGGTGCTPTSDFANVAIHGGAEANASGIFSGMIIVAGSLAISGDFHMHGMVYVVNDLTYTGTGNGEIDGAVFSRNIRDTSSTSIDTNTGGNASINYNCAYVKNPGGQMPQGFSVEAGTYKEVSGTLP
jgi:Tfp pilus assembly protein PilX